MTEISRGTCHFHSAFQLTITTIRLLRSLDLVEILLDTIL